MSCSSSSRAVIRVALSVALLLLLLAPAGCMTPEKRIQRFRDAWGNGNYAVAEAEIDRLISNESGVELEEGVASRDLTDLVDAEDGNTCLYLLDKAMVRAARGDYQAAVKILRSARDALDARNDGTTLADVGSLLVDDVVRPFRGADYEVILTRVMLAIFDLLVEAKDAYSYALQIGEKQE